MPKATQLIMPEVGPNCLECPFFTQCSAAVGMRAVAELVTIANDGAPLAPWARRTLQEQGLTGSGVAEGSNIEQVADAVQACEGVMTTVTKPETIPANSFTYAPMGTVVRRRTIASQAEPDSPKTVAIPVGKGGQIRKLDVKKGASGFTKFGDYEITFPAREIVTCPYGTLDSKYLVTTENLSVRDASTSITDAVRNARVIFSGTEIGIVYPNATEAVKGLAMELGKSFITIGNGIIESDAWQERHRPNTDPRRTYQP